jgi:hypothetical protein
VYRDVDGALDTTSCTITSPTINYQYVNVGLAPGTKYVAFSFGYNGTVGYISSWTVTPFLGSGSADSGFNYSNVTDLQLFYFVVPWLERYPRLWYLDGALYLGADMDVWDFAQLECQVVAANFIPMLFGKPVRPAFRDGRIFVNDPREGTRGCVPVDELEVLDWCDCCRLSRCLSRRLNSHGGRWGRSPAGRDEGDEGDE